MIQKVARQMEKLVDVLKVFVHTSDQIIYQEIALFKVTTNGLMSGNIIDQIVGLIMPVFLRFHPNTL